MLPRPILISTQEVDQRKVTRRAWNTARVCAVLTLHQTAPNHRDRQAVYRPIGCSRSCLHKLLRVRNQDHTGTGSHLVGFLIVKGDFLAGFKEVLG
jgi:hypothetical protein